MRVCVVAGLLLAQGCCLCGGIEPSALECPRDQVYTEAGCEPCPAGSTYEAGRSRISGRTSGATIREHTCVGASGLVGPYAKTNDDDWLIEGGHYNHEGRRIGEWLEYPSFGYGGRPVRGHYEGGVREGTWEVFEHGEVIRTREYRAGQLVIPGRTEPADEPPSTAEQPSETAEPPPSEEQLDETAEPPQP